MSYSVFIHRLKEAGIQLNRKILSNLAATEPETFARIVERVKPQE